MSARRTRLLILAALLAGVLVAAGVRPSLAGSQGPTCCLCQCQGQPTQCFAAGSPGGCDSFLTQCEEAANNATCRVGFIPGNCSEVTACASVGIPAPAPTLDVSGLAAAVVILSSLAALRLRRLARQRSRSR